MLAYRPIDGCWTVTDEVVVADSIWPERLAHYDGCVNIGVPDTLLLRVENADARLHYHWKIPAEWEPIGDTNRGELRVITHETKDTTRVYGVQLLAAADGYWVFDTVQVKGADTTLFMLLIRYSQYFATTPQWRVVGTQSFDLWWYKGDFLEENLIVKTSSVGVSQLGEMKPLLKYRIKENNTCWSVTDEVVVYDSVWPIRLKHYDGCVNIGILHLQQQGIGNTDIHTAVVVL